MTTHQMPQSDSCPLVKLVFEFGRSGARRGAGVGDTSTEVFVPRSRAYWMYSKSNRPLARGTSRRKDGDANAQRNF